MNADEKAFWTEQFTQLRANWKEVYDELKLWIEKYGNLTSGINTKLEELKRPVWYKDVAVWVKVAGYTLLLILVLLLINSEQCVKFKDLIEIGQCTKVVE